MELFRGLEHVVREQEPLAPYTWFRLGGDAEYFSEPTSRDELLELVRRCHEQEIPVRLLGGGSNLLVRDAGVPGLVIHLSAPAFAEIKVDGSRLIAGGGAKLSHVISTAVREGLAGLEPLVGIPGTVGGALHGNAGTQHGDVGQRTLQAVVMTRAAEVIERSADDLRFAYRQSSLDELAILEATFQLEPEDASELTKRMQTQWIIKKAAQPTAGLNTGCIFADPPGADATSLIEQAGLRSVSRGGARLSGENANFIVVSGEATSDDVLDLIEKLRSGVAERVGVELEADIEIW